ncbi:MAG: hypothetical protein JSV51_05155 [Candidatus Bathyarchaeota archaeon]|nr:MAG: hypothetical protein JSV51_05155 [Candidatus Bathyarchaeota archaeon]
MRIKRFLGIISLFIIIIGIGIQAAILLQSFSTNVITLKITTLNLGFGGIVQPNGGDDVPGPGWPGPG